MATLGDLWVEYGRTTFATDYAMPPEDRLGRCAPVVVRAWCVGRPGGRCCRRICCGWVDRRRAARCFVHASLDPMRESVRQLFRQGQGADVSLGRLDGVVHPEPFDLTWFDIERHGAGARVAIPGLAD